MDNILVIGASGYVGGTVLAHLLGSTQASLQSLTFDLLVIVWTGLDDICFVEQIVVQNDIIIDAGSGFITAGAKAFVDGLAHRTKAGLPTPWLLHLSGCTNLVDPSQKPREWNDETDGQAMFEFMKSLETAEPYAQQTTEITVLETASEQGVQAVSLQAPCIFGEGTGLFNQQALVIPVVLRYVMQHGHGFKLNDRANFDWVHVVNLADYYVLLIRTILERPDRGVGYIPSGKQSILFPTVGRILMTDINQQAVNTAFDAGVLPREDTPQQREVRLVPL